MRLYTTLMWQRSLSLISNDFIFIVGQENRGGIALHEGISCRFSVHALCLAPPTGVSLAWFSLRTGRIFSFSTCIMTWSSLENCHTWVYVTVGKSRGSWLCCPSLLNRRNGMDYTFIFEFLMIGCFSRSNNKRILQGGGSYQLHQIGLIKQEWLRVSPLTEFSYYGRPQWTWSHFGAGVGMKVLGHSLKSEWGNWRHC